MLAVDAKGLAANHEKKKRLTRSRLGKCVAVAIVACSLTMTFVGHRIISSDEFSLQQARGGSSFAEEDGDANNRGDLKCDDFGGPADASDLVYWRDSPQDRKKRSPYESSRNGGRKKYLTVVRAVFVILSLPTRV